ncbi:MAG: vitamin K epoxide reductase family protein [Pseudomonadota bacterium]
MNERRLKLISFISFGASALIAAQVLIIIFKGEAACLNEGCKVVESLTRISPLLFNLIGFIFFQCVCWVFYLARKKGNLFIEFARLILLAGLTVEGVLLAYQIYVANTFCSYCLIIFAFVFLLNILAGTRQIVAGTALLAGIIAVSSMLSYGPTALLSKNQTIHNGTYGSRPCSTPKKELYLFFSADCPHCKNVLTALEGCSSCNFHFNPIEKIGEDVLNGNLERTASYDPELNKLLLKLLGIDAIPVLLEKTPSGFSIIRGEAEIISYVRQSCYLADPLLYLNKSEQDDQNNLPIFNQEGECSVSVECDEEKK